MYIVVGFLFYQGADNRTVISIMFLLIVTITNFSNLIGFHQP